MRESPHLSPCSPRHGRFKRSNSVTAAVQADLELEGFPGHTTMEDKGLQFGSSFQRHSEPSTPTQYGAVRTVRTQGLFSYREDYRTQVDTSSLPAPEPWLEPALEPVETGRMSPCRRDGSWFLKLLHTETKRMEGWCKEMEREAEENDLSEESKEAGLARAPPQRWSFYRKADKPVTVPRGRSLQCLSECRYICFQLLPTQVHKTVQMLG